MKNGARLTAWLDYCEETIRRGRSMDVELVESVIDRSIESDRLYTALIADGWTRDELDAAYAKRMNISAATIAAWRAGRMLP